MNELALNQEIHAHAFLSNDNAEVTKWKDWEFLKIVEAKLSDKTRAIKLNLFKDIVKSIVESKGCSSTYFRIGKYDVERYLKTSERTIFTVNEDIAEEEVKVTMLITTFMIITTVLQFEFAL